VSPLYNLLGPDHTFTQKYSRLRCLLRVKGLVICFYLGWSGSILQFRQNIIKVGSKSWLLTCSSKITLSLPAYTGSALKRELNLCNDYLSLLYFCLYQTILTIIICQNHFLWQFLFIISDFFFQKDFFIDLSMYVNLKNNSLNQGRTYVLTKYLGHRIFYRKWQLQNQLKCVRHLFFFVGYLRTCASFSPICFLKVPLLLSFLI
jgi:hypothetical protein